MKRLASFALCFIILLGVMPAYSQGSVPSYQLGQYESVSYELVYDTQLTGYTLNIREGNQGKWTSTKGPIGLRVVTQNNNVQDWSYTAYTSVTVMSNGWKAHGTIASQLGTKLKITDLYKLENGGINIARTIEVVEVVQGDKGFQVSMPIRTSQSVEPTDLKWFTPSSWYGNDQDNFLSRSKMAFDGIEASSAADNLGIPMIYNYDNTSGWGLTVTDITEGLKETISADAKPQSGKVLVDERINVPGIGMKKVGDRTEVFQAFPGHTYNYRNRYNGKPVIYRFTPVRQGITKETGIRITYKSASDFLAGYRDAWRENYDRIAVVDHRVDPQTHFETLLQYVDDSYGLIGGRPQYCTNYDHKQAKSGFLWRNTDLAWVMLAQGWSRNKDVYREHARNVIMDQINNGGLRGNSRESAESHLALIRAYQVDKANGVNQNQWLNTCTAYADQLGSTPDYYQIKFLDEMYKVTGNGDYLSKAERAGDHAWEQGHKNLRFRASLTDYAGGPAEHDREAGYLALEAYMALYKQTGVNKWLERAKVAADFAETWNMVQNLKTNPEDAAFNSRMFGNDIPPYGLSGVHAGSNTGDQYQALNAVEFYQLYEATGDQHYLDFAEFIEFNSILYTNLGDKQGYMADWVQGSGYGFTNEYLGTAANTYGGNCRRGDGHDSNLGWTTYVLLAMTQRTLDYVDRYTLSEKEAEPIQQKPDSQPITEDFQGGSDVAWTQYEGSWTRSEGLYKVGAHPGAKSIIEDAYYTNFILEADVVVEGQGDAGIIFRNNGALNGADNFAGYYFGIKPSSNKIILGKANGGWKLIKDENLNLDENQVHHIKIVAYGPKILVYINGALTPQLQATDYSWIKGNIGFRTYQGNASFDNLSVRHIETLPQPTPQVLFEENFEADILEGWEEYQGVWTVTSSVYKVSPLPGAKSVVEDKSFHDFTYEADVKVGSGGNAGLIFRVTEPNNGVDAYKGYYVGLNPEKNKVEFGKANNNWIGLREVTMELQPNQFYHIKIVAKGDRLKVYIEDMDQAIIDLTDQSYQTGSIGMRTYNAHATFDNVKISSVSP